MATDAFGGAADHAGLSGLTVGDPHSQYDISTQGTLATRPAQPVRAAARFFATDELREYRSDGATWWPVGPPATRQFARAFLTAGV